MREYHAAGGTEYQADELKVMLLRRMLPCDEKKRLIHREFVDGALGTVGEGYDAMRLRVLETIAREEIEQQAREGRILEAENHEEHVFGGDGGGEEVCGGEPMGDEELNNLFAAIDSEGLTEENVNAIQRQIQRKDR